ncbi:hypothetical protein EMCRGX_G020580 [Ephydatia muelleri]
MARHPSLGLTCSQYLCTDCRKELLMADRQQPPSSQQELQQPPSSQQELQQPFSSQQELQQSSSSQQELQQPSLSQQELQQPSSSQQEFQQPPSSQQELQQPFSSQQELQQPSSSQRELQQPSFQQELQQPSSSQQDLQQSSSSQQELQQPSFQQELQQPSFQQELQQPSFQQELQQPSSSQQDLQQPSSSHGTPSVDYEDIFWNEEDSTHSPKSEQTSGCTEEESSNSDGLSHVLLKRKTAHTVRGAQAKKRRMDEGTRPHPTVSLNDGEESNSLRRSLIPQQGVKAADRKREHKQKRLLLCNLKEAYSEFKGRHPDTKIGFSKFAMLRPRECILAGAAGTHSSYSTNHCKLLSINTLSTLWSSSSGLQQIVPLWKQGCFKLTSLWTVITMLKKLLVHDFTAKMQSSFMQQKKESLKEGEFLVIADFSENFSFVVQDEVQSFHWNNSSANIHPFVCYYREKQDLKSLCYIIISESTQHDTIAVHLFQGKLVEFLSQKSQYKNCKKFTNLCYHAADFGVQAEWYFFATSHGKSAGDGAGGTLKRLATRASLQHLYQDHILTAEQLYQFAVSEIKGMYFGFATLSEHEQEAKVLEDRLKSSRTVPGTHQLHSVVPVSTTVVEVKSFSSS